MEDDKDNNNIKDDISYEKYKLLLELKKEKELNDLVKNKNLTIQEKMIMNLEKELIQLQLDQKNLIYSNEEMLNLYPNDKDVIESREINLKIYNQNEKRIKEIKQKIEDLQINLQEENKNKKIEENKNKSNNNEKKDEKNNNINTIEEIVEELEL